jgi:lipopolysaccharide/colanic/teichoic acid biosynthesis glycosyltransferase
MAFNRRETALLLIGDFLILAASLWVALLIRNLSIPSSSYFESNFIPFLPMFFISLSVFYISGLYDKQTRPIRSVMGVRIFGAQAATVLIAAILFLILPLSIAPKTILVLYLIISVVAESAWRFYRMNREIADGNRTSAILVGSGLEVDELYDEVNGNGQYLIRFIKREEGDGAHAEIRFMDDKNMVMTFASIYEEIFDRVPLHHFDARRMVRSLSAERSLYDIFRRMFDYLLAAVLSIVAIPIILAAAAILAVEGGPPFIHPERIGRGGKMIRLHKLRTMLFNDNGDPELQKKNSVTRFGRFLRKSRIDELPQLWNILTGELSFIGPRPEFPKIAEVYEKEVPQYNIRHLINPGMSGWAQIHDYDAPRGGADVERTKRKLSYDLYYLKHRSFWLDLAIALKTLRALASFSGT